MPITIIPFAETHLDSAAVLLAARHRAARAAFPELPARFEHPDETAAVLQDLLAVAGTSGVVAVRDGAAIGYLLGVPEFHAPTDAFAGLTPPRSIGIPYAGHAVAPEVRNRLSPRLYAALAKRWVAEGFTAHNITLPADRDAEDIWFDLGFGRYAALAIRDTSVLTAEAAPDAARVEIRRASDGDREAVREVPEALNRYWAESPLFLPFLPESAAAQRQMGLDLFNDPACHVWLAFRDGQLAGVQIFLAPESSHWFIVPMETPEQAVYLFIAYTAPEARGTGIGAALLRHTLAWAREAGYGRCLLHYMSATQANGFWRGHGFRPLHHWLSRAVDERAIWATGRG